MSCWYLPLIFEWTTEHSSFFKNSNQFEIIKKSFFSDIDERRDYIHRRQHVSTIEAEIPVMQNLFASNTMNRNYPSYCTLRNGTMPLQNFSHLNKTNIVRTRIWWKSFIPQMRGTFEREIKKETLLNTVWKPLLKKNLFNSPPLLPPRSSFRIKKILTSAPPRKQHVGTVLIDELRERAQTRDEIWRVQTRNKVLTTIKR